MTDPELEKELEAERVAMIWCGTVIIVGLVTLFAWDAGLLTYIKDIWLN